MTCALLNRRQVTAKKTTKSKIMGIILIDVTREKKLTAIAGHKTLTDAVCLGLPDIWNLTHPATTPSHIKKSNPFTYQFPWYMARALRKNKRLVEQIDNTKVIDEARA